MQTPAIDYYQRLLPLLQSTELRAEQLPILLRLGQVLELVGQWDEAGSRYQQALVLAEALGDTEVQAQAQIAIGEIHRKQGRFPEAGSWYSRAGRGGGTWRSCRCRQGADLWRHTGCSAGRL